MNDATVHGGGVEAFCICCDVCMNIHRYQVAPAFQILCIIGIVYTFMVPILDPKIDVAQGLLDGSLDSAMAFIYGHSVVDMLAISHKDLVLMHLKTRTVCQKGSIDSVAGPSVRSFDVSKSVTTLDSVDD